MFLSVMTSESALSMPLLWFIAPVSSILALVVAYVFYRYMMRHSEGDDLMKKIALAVRQGANAYLFQQYKIVSIVFVFLMFFLIFLSYYLGVQSKWVPFAFLTGGLFSGLCGFLGMKTATYASARAAEAAKKSLNSALQIAFRSGAVMGLIVVGFGLLDICIWFLILYEAVPAFTDYGMDLHMITTTMLSFGMGASTQALFARVGGGIFTKAADVGADLVGKVEAGIPEDDPRNPATIADNVGDNVGDVAGMGADLYESYVGSILATAALGASAFMGSALQLKAVLLPMIISAIGCIASIIGIYAVRTKEAATQKNLLAALSRGINLSSLLVLLAAFPIIRFMLPGHFGVWGSMIAGLVAGIIIGKSTEYYTSHQYKPTQMVAHQSLTGPATVIIEGIAVGMFSTAIPVLAVSLAVIISYSLAGGFAHPVMGLYGVSLSAVGMLSTLGITLATDAYGPIADNAGGNAQMSKLDAYVRERTDALDSLGNTTAATGKGFAIGSAALTALALLAAYIEEIRAGLMRMGQTTIEFAGRSIDVTQATLKEFMLYYDVILINPRVIIGIFLGAMSAFFFCSLTMKAVGRAAGRMVEEVRRQFREIKGILSGETEPDYASCVSISTKGAQREMMLPSILAISIPVIVGLVLGVAGVMGLLIGTLATGFVLAVMMANAGGSWDNAKKYIEEGQHGGKGSPAHKAGVVGDTVGDPFKDTSGPSLNILIKLMSMVSVVVVGLTIKYSPMIMKFLHIE
ncbi:MAG: sodium-translocating pyrophosphatase [Chlamydiota bacterium]|nr:sodium-translocating pyrophosphatase [Chlamydiota bacterium]